MYWVSICTCTLVHKLKREGRGASEQRRKKKWRRVPAVEERDDRGLMLQLALHTLPLSGVCRVHNHNNSISGIM